MPLPNGIAATHRDRSTRLSVEYATFLVLAFMSHTTNGLMVCSLSVSQQGREGRWQKFQRIQLRWACNVKVSCHDHSLVTNGSVLSCTWSGDRCSLLNPGEKKTLCRRLGRELWTGSKIYDHNTRSKLREKYFIIQRRRPNMIRERVVGSKSGGVFPSNIDFQFWPTHKKVRPRSGPTPKTALRMTSPLSGHLKDSNDAENTLTLIFVVLCTSPILLALVAMAVLCSVMRTANGKVLILQSDCSSLGVFSSPSDAADCVNSTPARDTFPDIPYPPPDSSPCRVSLPRGVERATYMCVSVQYDGQDTQDRDWDEDFSGDVDPALKPCDQMPLSVMPQLPHEAMGIPQRPTEQDLSQVYDGYCHPIH